MNRSTPPGNRTRAGSWSAPTIPLLAAALAVTMPAATATVAAAQDGSGFYVGVDAGLALAPDLESTRTNVGIPTNCDQWLPDAVLNDGAAVPLPLDQCAPRALPASPNNFDLGAGWLAGVNAGYSMGRMRLEAEYFHRRHGGETLALVVPGDPKQREFVERSERIGSLRGHNVFVNLYHDFRDPRAARRERRVVPFVGAGVGWMRTQLDYAATSIRTNDRNALLDLGRNPNAAGTISRAESALTDDLVGYQLLAGLDYALTRRHALTFKVRYADAFGDFENLDNPWELLRSHESTVGPGGAPVRYGIGARNLGFWSVSVGFKVGL